MRMGRRRSSMAAACAQNAASTSLSAVFEVRREAYFLLPVVAAHAAARRALLDGRDLRERHEMVVLARHIDLLEHRGCRAVAACEAQADVDLLVLVAVAADDRAVHQRAERLADRVRRDAELVRDRVVAHDLELRRARADGRRDIAHPRNRAQDAFRLVADSFKRCHVVADDGNGERLFFLRSEIRLEARERVDARAAVAHNLLLRATALRFRHERHEEAALLRVTALIDMRDLGDVRERRPHRFERLIRRRDGERRRHDGQHDFLRAVERGLPRVLPHLAMADDVLDDDNGIIDEQADGKREA